MSNSRLHNATSPFRVAALFTLLAALGLPAGASSQSRGARAPLVVTTAWLAQHIADSTLVLLHVGAKPEYDHEHLPRARFVSMADISAPHPAEGRQGLSLELPAPEQLREKLQSFGISDDSHIIVYWGNDWVAPSTRVVYTLDWIGLGDRVSILDSGMPAWKKNGGPVTAEVAPPRPGKLSARPVKGELFVDVAFVRSLPKSGFALVDARTGSFYDGVQAGNGVLGHIPGAGSVPFSDLATDDNRLRSPEELRASFAKAGVAPGATVVAYCHIGQQATFVLFAARSLGHAVRLYDGSMQDWATRKLPVDATPAKRELPVEVGRGHLWP